MELGHFDKHFVKNIQKKRQGIILEFFLLDTVKTTFRMKFRLKSWAFFPKIRTLFLIFKKKKKQWRPSPSSTIVARLHCLDEVSTVNSDVTNFLGVQHLHKNIQWVMGFYLSLTTLCLQKRCCCSAFLY